MKLIEEGSLGAEHSVSLRGVGKEPHELQKQLTGIEGKRKEHESYIDQKTKLETSIKTLEREIQDVADKTGPALSIDTDSLEEKYCEVLDLLLQERQLLVELYRPLKDSLAQADSTAKKLGFHSRVSFEPRKAATRLLEILDQRSSLRDQADLEKLLEDFFQKLTDSVREEGGKEVFDRAAVRATMKELGADLMKSP